MKTKPIVLVLCSLVLCTLSFLAGRSTRTEAVASSTTAAPSTRDPFDAPEGARPLSAREPFSSADVAQRAAAAEFVPGSLSDEDQQLKALERWAERDASAALAYARSHLKGDRQAQAISNLLATWGKQAPAEAWAWVTREMPGATHHFDTLLEVFGRNDPAVALRFADGYAAVHPDASLEVHLAALLGITYRGDFSTARTAIASNPQLSPEVRSNLQNFLAGQWARFAPAEAAAWANQLPAGPERDQALIGVGESWSDVDAGAAASFASNLPAGEPRTLALRQAISKWVVEDPGAAREWVLKNNRHEDFDQAVQAIATETNLMNRQPARAMLWASGIFDNAVRTQSERAILATWLVSDREGAAAYLRTSNDFTEEQKQQLLTQNSP